MVYWTHLPSVAHIRWLLLLQLLLGPETHECPSGIVGCSSELTPSLLVQLSYVPAVVSFAHCSTQAYDMPATHRPLVLVASATHVRVLVVLCL